MRQRILDLVHAVHQLLHLIVELVDLLRHLAECVGVASREDDVGRHRRSVVQRIGNVRSRDPEPGQELDDLHPLVVDFDPSVHDCAR